MADEPAAHSADNQTVLAVEPPDEQYPPIGAPCSVWEYLSRPLPSYEIDPLQPQPRRRSAPKPGPSRSLQHWIDTKIGNLWLNKTQWKWNNEEPVVIGDKKNSYIRFRSWIEGLDWDTCKGDLWPERRLPFPYPQTEGDIAYPYSRARGLTLLTAVYNESYLPLESICKFLELVSPEVQLVNDLDKFKGLVPVELKNIGNLTLQNMIFLFGEGKAGQRSFKYPPAMMNAEQKALLSALRQTICYIVNYGSRYAFLTDLLNSVILRLPCNQRMGKGPGIPSGQVDWAFISSEHSLRLALASLVFLAHNEIDQVDIIQR